MLQFLITGGQEHDHFLIDQFINSLKKSKTTSPQQVKGHVKDIMSNPIEPHMACFLLHCSKSCTDGC